ncbi:uncharacterized protein TNCV_1288021 [Trichonephila clavipes]|nr:uncharacterized protein TNCV_1288021 [Trichonephila clavipes]
MDVCKCIVPSLHGGTPNSRRATSPLEWLVEGEERWETSGHPQNVLPLNWGGTEPNRTVTCIVLKATANDRRHLALCHDEFRGPRSGLCRSDGIGNNNDNRFPHGLRQSSHPKRRRDDHSHREPNPVGTANLQNANFVPRVPSDGWCYTRCDNTDSLWVLIDAFAVPVTPTNEYIGCDLPTTSGAPSIKMDHVNCVGWNESVIPPSFVMSSF